MQNNRNVQVNRSIGIIAASNLRVGGTKLVAMAANDLALKGYDVQVFVPLLPWYYYFVSLGKNPLRWFRYVWPHFFGCIRERKFSFLEMLSDNKINNRARTKFVLRKASANQLGKMDYLILISVEQMTYYRDRFPQEKQIYLLLHPEERVHSHGDLFTQLRKSFRGKTLVVSPVIAQEVSDHIINPAMVPIPVSPIIWEKRSIFDPSTNRKDILLSWKDSAHGAAGSKIIRALTDIRPETTFTVWCTVPGIRSGVEKELPGATIIEDLSEVELGNIYLNHSILIYPSTYEGFGMPPIEALACGCIPVLHPQVGAAQLYAKDGENSIHLGNNPRNTASRIAHILDHSETLITMRKNAPQSIDIFDPSGYGERILEAADAL